jgi:hypothetical protein
MITIILTRSRPAETDIAESTSKMERFKIKIFMKFTMAVGMAALAACHNHRHEGEQAGRHIDNAVDVVHDTAVRAERNIRREAHEAKERTR